MNKEFGCTIKKQERCMLLNSKEGSATWKEPHEPLLRSSLKDTIGASSSQNSICAKYGRHAHYVSHADG
ncbi:unnamed protein product, partial [Sphenostylis stenocarpa]